MPLDPATIRATAQRVVDEFRCSPDTATSVRSVLMRDALVQAGADLAAQSLADAERAAARKAWDAAMTKSHGGATALWQARARDEYLAREYPETRECVLSDGSVVTYEAPGEVSAKPASMFVRRHRGVQADWWHDDWRVFAITGADFDKLKAFAEAVR